MEVIRLTIATGEQKVIKYPNLELAPLPSTFGIYKYYAIVNESVPTFDPEKSYLKHRTLLSEDKYDGMDHILVAYKGYDVVDFSQAQIIDRLNTSVGEHIESNMPLWKQNKYLARYIYLFQLYGSNQITPEQLTEMQWLGDIDTWSNQCRSLRDQKEAEYINSGLFPDFNWPEFPIKHF